MRREGLKRGDIAELLEHISADCAGAVSILPIDHPPIKRPGYLPVDYNPLDEDAFAEPVERLATEHALPDKVRDHSPVADVRSKISLTAMPGCHFGLPKRGSGAPAIHILKLADPDHLHEVHEQALVTLLAAQCGFCTASLGSSGDQVFQAPRRFQCKNLQISVE